MPNFVECLIYVQKAAKQYIHLLVPLKVLELYGDAVVFLGAVVGKQIDDLELYLGAVGFFVV